jgi:hypothetical protein
MADCDDDGGNLNISGCGVSPSDKSDADDLGLWILRRLGAPLLKIELTEEHIMDAVAQGLRWFAAKKGFIKVYNLQLQPGVSEYCLPSDIDVVTEVIFPFSNYDMSPNASPWAWAWPNENMMVPYGYGYGNAGGGAVGGETGGYLSSVQQVLQYTETARRIVGADPEWRQEHNKLFILPTRLAPTTPKALVYYTSNTFNLTDLKQRDFDLVRRYALAMAKRDLGRIRSKYDQYPTAQGSTGLDGATLLGEADNEVAILDEEIGQSAMPIGFMVG